MRSCISTLQFLASSTKKFLTVDLASANVGRKDKVGVMVAYCCCSNMIFVPVFFCPWAYVSGERFVWHLGEDIPRAKPQRSEAHFDDFADDSSHIQPRDQPAPSNNPTRRHCWTCTSSCSAQHINNHRWKRTMTLTRLWMDALKITSRHVVCVVSTRGWRRFVPHSEYVCC